MALNEIVDTKIVCLSEFISNRIAWGVLFYGYEHIVGWPFPVNDRIPLNDHDLKRVSANICNGKSCLWTNNRNRFNSNHPPLTVKLAKIVADCSH